MKVCLLNDSFPPVIDGVANVVMNYGQILQENNLAEVAVATPEYPDADYTTYPYKVVPYQSFDTTKFVKGYRTGNPFDISELNELVDFGPDIIHSHCPFSFTIMARLIKFRTGAPLILTYHTKFDVDIARAVKMKKLQDETIKVLVRNIEACDEVWVVSKGAGENLRSLGYTGEYVVMNNGVDFAKGRVDAETVQKVTRDYDLPENVPVFLFVGRIMAYKGLPLILDALAQLEKQDFDYRMVFIGGGPDEQLMQEKASELGLKHCIFTGPISDRQALRAWNTRANLFLFPSTYDTNGIVVREAAACGLASVLIEGSCAAEGITHGRNGYLIEETADSMAKLLLEVGSDLEQLSVTGQHAMDEIYISWDESVRAAYARYEVIMENHKNGMYETSFHQREEQFKQYMQEMIDKVQEPIAKAGNLLDNIVDNMKDDMDTMLGNAIKSVDDRLDEMYRLREKGKEALKDSLREVRKWLPGEREIPNKIVTICGSMKFQKEMQKVSEKLELQNDYVVIQCIYPNEEHEYSQEELQCLRELHYRKIELSDAIYIVNVGGYIGESVRQEIEYARSLGKEILSMEPIEV